MKKQILEYHPNGCPKIILYKRKGNRTLKTKEWHNDKNLPHRLDDPAVLQWNKNNALVYAAFYNDGYWCNISNPARIWFSDDHHIHIKGYYISNMGSLRKLNWMNLIKNI